VNGQPNPSGILVDENLSPALADAAAVRGFAAQAVARLRKLRGRGDHVVARYAIDRDMILVTSDMIDFQRIYQQVEAHPGIVFFVAHAKLRKKAWQLKMMEMALDEIEIAEPVEQALVITATPDAGGFASLRVDRHHLPDVATRNAIE
jgi:predicted nuclease of predicted toxin-antitoxin system